MENLKLKQAYERMLLKKIENKLTGCWETSSSLSSNGYGQITVNRKYWNTHRFSFFVNNNFIPLLDDHHICHKCDNKKCFNPHHLYQGTKKQNAQDAQERNEKLKEKKIIRRIKKLNPDQSNLYKKGDNQGENNIKSILKEHQVIEIRERYSKGLKYGKLKKMAEEYGIKYITIQKIVNREIWKHII